MYVCMYLVCVCVCIIGLPLWEFCCKPEALPNVIKACMICPYAPSSRTAPPQAHPHLAPVLSAQPPLAALAVLQVVQQFPDMVFVLDHLGHNAGLSCHRPHGLHSGGCVYLDTSMAPCPPRLLVLCSSLFLITATVMSS